MLRLKRVVVVMPTNWSILRRGNACRMIYNFMVKLLMF